MPDARWYRDAVFYELHVKAFQDANADGVGDFRGLIDRLDYVQELGVDCIWLLPFYPSPLKDDGYDIADYYGVHPSYGTLEDFQRFLDEAHRRGLRVIADLVLNHTSADHPWFQRARRAPKGSPERDFYVWSDTDEKYAEARIIFTDTEPSNWTWDPVAGQYYWHRFFAHQPDLNWDNPVVKEKMFRVMEYWLEKGLDGFRCDAVPYLIEREGTNCENLPETHAILKEFRARLDERFLDKILLAEANQWPDDVRPYFGDGDEFHMAFHFPLMPRIFMAVRQGVREPIVEIIEQTPEIPDGCQWCMFLRNHDELTLEMVTDEERDYMYQEYAADPRMRLNLGIRRRLAPLMDNDRRKIELLNSILFTMPGTPIVYYGDEIGMGDNIYLGDRDGVRTPMQWSPDRNGGFSRAEAARLYLPVITDSVYGYQAINVEAQQKSPYSLLHWMKRLIQVRKQHHAFGRGTIDFLEPKNPHVLAYLREYEGEAILVVNNLSGSAQPVRLDLSRFAGRKPVEMLGQTAFLPIDETPYALTLSPYGFFWFMLHAPATEEEARLRLPGEWAEQEMRLFERPEAVGAMVSAIPREWLLKQRWFRGKSREVVAIELCDHAVLDRGREPRVLLTTVRVRYEEGEPELYFMPFTLLPGEGAEGLDAEPILVHTTEAGEVGLYSALIEPRLVTGVLDAIRTGTVLTGTHGRFVGGASEAMPDLASAARASVRRVSAEQSNTSVIVDDRVVLKLYRRLEPGMNPEVEMTRFLVEQAGFRAAPALLGWAAYEGKDGTRSVAAGVFDFVANKGDAWAYTRRALNRYFSAAVRSAADPETLAGREATRRMAGDYLASVRTLGRVTGAMHAALASAPPGDPDFAPEPITPELAERWIEAFRADVERVFSQLGRRLDAMPGAFPEHALNELAALVREAPELREQVDDLRRLGAAGLLRTRYHGDYHLGQLLRTAGARPGVEGEWMIIDFEGEPARPLAERRAKASPLRDVAGMLRSFDYAVQMALDEQPPAPAHGATLDEWAAAWQRDVRALFLEEWRAAVAGSGIAPEDPAKLARVLAAFELEKAVYEVGYELNNRPEWIWVPARAIRRLMGGSA